MTCSQRRLSFAPATQSGWPSPAPTEGFLTRPASCRHWPTKSIAIGPIQAASSYPRIRHCLLPRGHHRRTKFKWSAAHNECANDTVESKSLQNFGVGRPDVNLGARSVVSVCVVLQCRNCGSQRIYQSRTRTKWERVRRKLTGKRPFRCHACKWRGWGVDVGPQFEPDDVELVWVPEILAGDFRKF